MRIGIKYCGGCNPGYDRTGFVAQLKEALGSGVEWMNAGLAEVPMDFVLVVCGCTAACAAHQDLHGEHGKRIVHTREQYDAVLEELLQFKK